MHDSSITTETLDTDVLVLGGGMAGYRAAIAAREKGARVVLAYRGHGASPHVIGFNAPIASVDDRDSPEVYAQDMVRGGYGLNDRALVRLLASKAVDAFHELQALGVRFAEADGRIAQRHLSGNTYPRSVYIAEGTGGAVMKALRNRATQLQVRILGACRAVDLLRDDTGGVAGALLWKPHTSNLVAVRAGATVLAMGGIGRLFADSTYPADVSADGLGFALDAGAALIDMEFVQFEPVVTVWPEQCRGMEMPTAMLGDGAQLRNALGERFMLRVNAPHGETRIEKARMALHIQREIDEGRGVAPGGVYFDTTTVPRAKLESYVSHCSRLRSAGLEPTTDRPIVAPAAHSMMGGVAIDAQCHCGVPGLYIGGETAGGVHGASRIAGNGCADTLVFGALAGASAAEGLRPLRPGGFADAQALLRLRGEAIGIEDTRACKEAIRAEVAAAAGIWRCAESLTAGQRALEQVREHLQHRGSDSLAASIELLEARRMADVALAIVGPALLRTESRGAHQRTDHPGMDDTRWLVHTACRKDAQGRLTTGSSPIRHA